MGSERSVSRPAFMDPGEMLTGTDDVEAEGQNEVVFEADGDCC